jgi:hypothetical protein
MRHEKVRNGGHQAILDNGDIPISKGISLPEHASASAGVPESRSGSAPRLHSPRLARPEQAKGFEKQIVEVS